MLGKYGVYLTWKKALQLIEELGIPILFFILSWQPTWVKLLSLLVIFRFIYSHRKLFNAVNYLKKNQDTHKAICKIVLDQLPWKGHGKILDVGTGGGLMAIGAALRFPESYVIGIDTWTAGFIGFNYKLCERNAQIEGVSKVTKFEKVNAASLPYPDETFDAVISNSVFHLVKDDKKDAKQVMREALRVLKVGGGFSFNDPFEIKSIYGELDDLMHQLHEEGFESLQYASMSDLMDVPPEIKHLTIGSGILSGIKGNRNCST